MPHETRIVTNYEREEQTESYAQSVARNSMWIWVSWFAVAMSIMAWQYVIGGAQ